MAQRGWLLLDRFVSGQYSTGLLLAVTPLSATRLPIVTEMFSVLRSVGYTLSQMKSADPIRRQTFLRSRWTVTALLASLAYFITVPLQVGAHSTPGYLLIYTVDVEGGQATLFVAPGGGSLLVDTGWPGNSGRDAERIKAAMKDAGITKIDHVLITHFHTDHVGGVTELVKRVQVGEFLDHGANREDSDITRTDTAAYMKAIQGKPRRVIHPGDTIAISGLTITVLTADGAYVSSIPGIKPVPNPYCASDPKWDLDETETPRPAGILIRFGSFRFLDLGDLTKPKEVALVCPNNPIGTVDLYLVTH